MCGGEGCLRMTPANSRGTRKGERETERVNRSSSGGRRRSKKRRRFEGGLRSCWLCLGVLNDAEQTQMNARPDSARVVGLDRLVWRRKRSSLFDNPSSRVVWCRWRAAAGRDRDNRGPCGKRIILLAQKGLSIDRGYCLRKAAVVTTHRDACVKDSRLL